LTRQYILIKPTVRRKPLEQNHFGNYNCSTRQGAVPLEIPI
jgi:hypothetical protein